MAKGKVLIIEDDTVLVRMYAKKLEHDGFEVVAAYSGGEGLSVAPEAQPDAILLDIMMPAMDGFTVIRTLKQDPATKDIPVIILTNLGTSKIFVEEAKRLGAKEYLVKYKTSTQEISEVLEKAIAEEQHL